MDQSRTQLCHSLWLPDILAPMDAPGMGYFCVQNLVCKGKLRDDIDGGVSDKLRWKGRAVAGQAVYGEVEEGLG